MEKQLLRNETMRKDTCKECKLWDNRFCRKDPPMIYYVRSKHGSITTIQSLPETAANEWCSSFETKHRPMAGGWFW